MTRLTRPARFLEVRARVVTPPDLPGVLGMCANYEGGRWRAAELAAHLCKWIPEWALRYGEAANPESGTMMEMIRRAALRVYTTEKYESRGEFGELMLHAIIRWEFDTEPAVSKIYFKDAANDTVKGFDCAHVVDADGALELWLGEAKFYKRVGKAVDAVAADLARDLQTDFLRTEFAFITDKLDGSWAHAPQLRQLLRDENTLDAIFDYVRIPILLAYDSEVIADHDRVSGEYIAAVHAEAEAIRDDLLAKLGDTELPRTVRLELILVPIESKAILLPLLDKELRQWQGRT
jgi:hypothetical protein